MMRDPTLHDHLPAALRAGAFLLAVSAATAATYATFGTDAAFCVATVALMGLYGFGSAVVQQVDDGLPKPVYGLWLLVSASLLSTVGLYTLGRVAMPGDDRIVPILKGIVWVPFGVAVISRFRVPRAIIALQIVCCAAILYAAGISIAIITLYVVAGLVLSLAWPRLRGLADQIQARLKIA
jgi:putative effector of murein hydrolase LrgA (UPF0299 family)